MKTYPASADIPLGPLPVGTYIVNWYGRRHAPTEHYIEVGCRSETRWFERALLHEPSVGEDCEEGSWGDADSRAHFEPIRRAYVVEPDDPLARMVDAMVMAAAMGSSAAALKLCREWFPLGENE